jgi:hypothetical protein
MIFRGKHFFDLVFFDYARVKKRPNFIGLGGNFKRN